MSAVQGMLTKPYKVVVKCAMKDSLGEKVDPLVDLMPEVDWLLQEL